MIGITLKNTITMVGLQHQNLHKSQLSTSDCKQFTPIDTSSSRIASIS